jgi:hypothetical protein
MGLARGQREQVNTVCLSVPSMEAPKILGARLGHVEMESLVNILARCFDDRREHQEISGRI